MLYAVAVPLIGAIITVMNLSNSLFAARVGSLVSVVVAHAVGLIAAVAVIPFVREKAIAGARPPAYLYAGGLVGVGTVFACIYAFTALDASLAVALALLGQVLFSLAVDASGFLGRPRYPLSLRSLPGLAIAACGILVMAGLGDRGGPSLVSAPAALLAMAGGALPLLSIALNAELGRRVGVVRSVRANYFLGLCATLVVAAAIRPPLREASAAIAGAGPLLVFGGGLLGLVVVGGMNVAFPRLPAFTASLLLFAGQTLAGVVIDAIRQGGFEARKLVGAALLLAGLAVKGLLSERRAG